MGSAAGAPAAGLPGNYAAWLAARACGLSVTVALGAGDALGIGGGAATAALAGGGTTALAAVDAAPVDGRLILRLGVIMRRSFRAKRSRAR
jgi:hypothetical protein